MTSDEQLERWVAGDPQHNHDLPDGGECCPDFSCCTPETLAPRETRVAFAKANSEERNGMLMMFLGAAIANHYGKPADEVVHIVGDPTNEQEAS